MGVENKEGTTEGDCQFREHLSSQERTTLLYDRNESVQHMKFEGIPPEEADSCQRRRTRMPDVNSITDHQVVR